MKSDNTFIKTLWSSTPPRFSFWHALSTEEVRAVCVCVCVCVCVFAAVWLPLQYVFMLMFEDGGWGVRGAFRETNVDAAGRL